MSDLFHNTKFVRLFTTDQHPSNNTPIISPIIDHGDFAGSVLVIHMGAIVDADVTFSLTGVHGQSPTLADGVAITDADLIGTLAGIALQFDSDNKVAKLGYKGGKRYTQWILLPSGNASAWDMGAVMALGYPRHGNQSAQQV